MNRTLRILAPLRGVTVRCFRETFAEELREAQFTEAITPFIPALPGAKIVTDRELLLPQSFPITPQFIGKDPNALSEALKKIIDLGFKTADLNAGCPYPMIRNKGRGSGLIKRPELLEKMLEVGCTVLGDRAFSVKTRLGVDSEDEIDSLIDIFNRFPLRFVTIHARTARQMYEGEAHIEKIKTLSQQFKVPVVFNGDIPVSYNEPDDVMIGRDFVRSLGRRSDSSQLLMRYIEQSKEELCGERPVLGRIKELLSYWKEIPYWRRLWPVLKLARSLNELKV